MKRTHGLRWLALAGIVLLFNGVAPVARGQADPDDVKRGVARISLMDGDVSVRRGDSGDWVAGVVNAPLMTGDSVATSPGSRAEVQFDAGNALRISGDTEVRMTQLEYGNFQVAIARGTVTYRVLRQDSAQVEIDTPNISMKPARLGAYRITVTDSGETVITARSGSVEVMTASGSQWVNAGQTMEARGSAQNPEFRFIAALGHDDWDGWNETRDRAVLDSASYGYVPAGVYGVEDLDRYGNWVYVTDYGYCWQPTVSTDWAPYGLGQWSWLDWYGWSWISYDPWGWAPYHYGRWFNRGNYWYWWPGSLYTQNYWSPALVGFFGWGGGGAGFGYNYVGWVPLAPFEPFQPWWGRRYYGHPDYVMRNVNITNVNVTNVYVNSRVRNAVTSVTNADFQSGRFRDVMHRTGGQIGQVGVVRGPIPIAPGTANLHFTDKTVAVAPRTANVAVAGRQTTAPVNRIPFDQQRRSFTQAGMVNRGVDRERVMSAAPARPGVDREPAQGGGWQRFGTPAAPGSSRAPSAPGVSRAPSAPRAIDRAQPAPAPQAPPQDRGGWTRFGTPGVASPGQNSPRQGNAPPAMRNSGPQYSNPGSSSPRDNSPRYSAPAPSAPAPAAPAGDRGGGGGRIR